MSRPLRVERIGGWYHITARGNERRAIFRDNADRVHFCELLGGMVDFFRVRLHAFVLMDNHYHLLLELTELNLSRAAHWLNLSYSTWFNRRHARSGHLFQGRFKSVVVDPLQWGLELTRYIHLNPVRVVSMGLGKADRQNRRAGVGVRAEAQLVKERVAHLRRYPWSSYRAFVGLSVKPDWLECERVLELGGGKMINRKQYYRDYVESAVREGVAKSPWEAVLGQVVLGGEQFLQMIRGHVRGDFREQPGARRLAHVRPTLDDIIGNVVRVKGKPWERLRDLHGDDGRDLVLYLGQRACGLKLRELARLTGMRDYSAVSIAIKRYERRLPSNHASQAVLRAVCQLSNVEM